MPDVDVRAQIVASPRISRRHAGLLRKEAFEGALHWSWQVGLVGEERATNACPSSATT